MQTFVANHAAEWMSHKLGTTVKIEGFSLKFFLDLELNNIEIQDKRDNTFIKIKSLTLDLQRFNYRNKSLQLKKIIIDQAEIGLYKYHTSGFNYSDLIRTFSNPDTINSTIDSSAIHFPQMNLLCNSLEVNNTRFIYNNETRSVRSGFDWNHMDLYVDRLLLTDFHLLHDTIIASIDSMRISDKSGLSTENLSGYFRLSPQFFSGNNVHITTKRSSLSMDYKFEFKNWQDWNNFENRISIRADIGQSRVNLADIGYFSKSLRSMYNSMGIKGKISGRIGHLRANDLDIRYGKATRFLGDISISGLPDIEESFILTDIKEFISNAEDLNSFRLPIYNGIQMQMELPGEITNLEFIRLKGRFTGFYNDFVSNASFNTGLGNFETDIRLKYNPEDDIYEYNGSLSTAGFDLGRFTGYSPALGKISLNTHIDGKGFSIKNASMELDGSIDTIVYRNYSYENITIDGYVSDKQFNGALNVRDNNIDFSFNGLIDYTDSIPVFNFVSHLKSARLSDLHLIPAGDPDALLSGRIDANFKGDHIDDILGSIFVDSLSLRRFEKDYLMKRASIQAQKLSDTTKHIAIRSDYLDANISGRFDFSKIAGIAKNFVNNYLASFQSRQKDIVAVDAQSFVSFDLHFKNTSDISEIFFPNFKLSEGTKISGNFQSGKAALYVKGSADEIIYNGIIFKGWFLHSSTLKNIMTFSSGVDELILRDKTKKDSLKIAIDNFSYYSNISNDKISFILKWDDNKKINNNSGNIRGVANFRNYPNTYLRFAGSSFIINDTLWRIPSGNSIQFDSAGLNIGRFSLNSPSEEISLMGNIAQDTNSSFSAYLKKVNLSNFDLLANLIGINPDGFIDGNITLNNLYHKPQIISDLRIENFKINGKYIGETQIRTHWDYDSKNIKINALSEIQGDGYRSKPIAIDGQYNPEQDSLQAHIVLQNLEVGIIQPYLEGVLSNLGGYASGDFHISGTLPEPGFAGTLSLMRGQMRIDYLNTLYTYTGNIDIDENNIGFRNFILYDSLGQSAPLFGNISHHYFDQFGFNLRLEPDNFNSLNTNKQQNSIFYGSALVSGAVDIKGTDDNILMNVNIESERGTDINIPLNTTKEVYENNFVTFTSDTISHRKSQAEENVNTNVSGLSLNMDMRLNNQANISIYLPDQNGSITAKGSGDLQMDIDEAGNFEIDGTYSIQSGSFIIRLQGILNRVLDIESGSKISFTGNPYDARVEMTAAYKIRTTLAGLDLPLDSSVLNVRTPVNCIVRLKEELMNPKISFGIYFPGVDEDIRNLIYSKLDTTDEVVMTKQFFSLIVLNNFSFQLNNNGIASSISTSSLSLISNQLSNWLSQISKDFDIGINYRPGNELSAEEVEVALSTELFDNRVIIDGNIGYADRQKYSPQASDIVGDVNVEIKITSDGRLRAKMFNRSNNVDLLNTTAPYTQGVGISYRRDFDKLTDLFKRKKKLNTKKKTEKVSDD